MGGALFWDLRRKRALVEGLHGRRVRFALISRSGFTSGLLQEARGSHAILLDLPGLAQEFEERYEKTR